MATRRRRIALVTAGVLATAGIGAGAVTAATSGAGDPAGDLADAINARAGSSISADDVTAAYRDLLKARLDEAVAAGRLTQDEADEMLRRAEDGPGLPGFGHPGGPGHGRGGRHAEVLDAVAAKLKLTEAQIRTRLEAGSTLAAVAEAQGVRRAQLIATIEAALTADGVPAARAGELAAHIADGRGHERGERRFHGPGGRP